MTEKTGGEVLRADIPDNCMGCGKPFQEGQTILLIVEEGIAMLAICQNAACAKAFFYKSEVVVLGKVVQSA